jgi:DNA-binding transcriptional MerR regulator
MAMMTKMTTTTNSLSKIQIPDRLYFRIGDVADLLGVKPYVLRYWESEFPMINPQKSSSGQRVYRRSDVEMLVMIKHLLYEERYSIEGARKRIRELRREGELKVFKTDKVLSESESDPAVESEPECEAKKETEGTLVEIQSEGVDLPAAHDGAIEKEIGGDSTSLVVTSAPAALSQVVSKEVREKILQSARELQKLAETPIHELFQF